MPKNLMLTQDSRDARRIEADREELAERLARAMPRDGIADPQPGVNLARFARPTELHHGFLEPCFCVIAQGAKTPTLGEDVFRVAEAMQESIGMGVGAEALSQREGFSLFCRRHLGVEPLTLLAACGLGRDDPAAEVLAVSPDAAADKAKAAHREGNRAREWGRRFPM